MHPPLIDDEGEASFSGEELYVIEHPSFKAILDQIRDIIEERSKDEIQHTRDYVPILQKAKLGAEEHPREAEQDELRPGGLRQPWMAGAWWCSYAMKPIRKPAASTR
jgi:hypothetical protein